MALGRLGLAHETVAGEEGPSVLIEIRLILFDLHCLSLFAHRASAHTNLRSARWATVLRLLRYLFAFQKGLEVRVVHWRLQSEGVCIL